MKTKYDKSYKKLDDLAVALGKEGGADRTTISGINDKKGFAWELVIHRKVEK